MDDYQRHSQLEQDRVFRPDDNSVSDAQEILYVDNVKYFEDLLSDIDAAKQTINIETFIFSSDFLADRVATHLTDAAKRGVIVRVMVDGMGALFSNAKFAQQMLQAGVIIKIFHPAPWRVWQWGYSAHVSRFLLAKLFMFIAKSNYRDHRKITVIDNDIAWIGSINITREHLPVSQGGDGWCDAAIRLKSMDFSDLNLAFEAEWAGQHYTKLFGANISNRHIRLNNTFARRIRLQQNLYKKIQHARRKIWIINAYFVPSTLLLRGLEEAAWSGVDVRMLLPGKNNHGFMSLAGAMFYEKLIEAGVKIYLYQPAMIHEKSMIIDTWATVGSSNLNHRSLFRDLEVDVVLNTTHARVELEDHFLDCLQHSEQLNLWALKKRAWWQRLLGHFLLLGRYFL